MANNKTRVKRKLLEVANKYGQAIDDTELTDNVTVLQLQRGTHLFEAYDAERQKGVEDANYRRGARETRWIWGFRNNEGVTTRRKVGYIAGLLAAAVIGSGLGYKTDRSIRDYGVAPVQSISESAGGKKF